MRVKLENKCSTCARRDRCKDRGAVVEWKNCKDYKKDLLLEQTLIRKQRFLDERNDRRWVG